MQCGSKQAQRGATALGMLTIVAILGLGLYAGIRLVPLYMDNFAVVKALKDTAATLQGGEVSVSSVRKSLNARWTVDYISSVAVEDIGIHPVPNGLEIRAAYEARAPFVANVWLVVEFDDAVVVSSRGL